MRGSKIRTSKLPQICKGPIVCCTHRLCTSLPIVCAHEDVSRDFKFTRYNLPLYLYTAEIMWTLWYITVSWLVHMCKQDIGMWKVIATTYKGSWSRRGELCYQLHKAIPMTQLSFWCYQIFMKKWELYISAKFEQNSENKESAYQIYKVCIWHYAYVWKVKWSYGVLDSVDKVGFAFKTPFLILHTCVAHDLRRTLAIFGTKVKFKLGAWTLHYFSTHNPPSFVKRW